MDTALTACIEMLKSQMQNTKHHNGTKMRFFRLLKIAEMIFLSGLYWIHII